VWQSPWKAEVERIEKHIPTTPQRNQLIKQMRLNGVQDPFALGPAGLAHQDRQKQRAVASP
jgi:hypothetical protein